MSSTTTATRDEREAWALAAAQWGAVAHHQLWALGYSRHAIHHRVATGRLHPRHRGVYAVGRPHLTLLGEYSAALLAAGSGALLSHRSAAALWRIIDEPAGLITVSVPAARAPKVPGLRVVRRRPQVMAEATEHRGLPVLSVTATLVDLATELDRDDLEAAVNAADRLDLIDPEALRDGLERLSRFPGVERLRVLLDRHTFTLTDSQLERIFKPIARRAGLEPPLTQQWLHGHRADFYWPALGLVVETDGLRYHRTPAQQAKDRRRDQVHTAAGLTVLRFTRAQVRFEPRHVERVVAAVAARLRREQAERSGRP